MDKSLRARLNRLFSTNVIVRKISKNRLRAIDTNKLQSSGNLSSKRYVSRFSGIQKGSPGYGTYNSNVNYHTNKIELYSDYEAMDMDPIISSALDIYADESTVKDAEGDTLTIVTPDDRIRKVLYNLFYDILNVDYNLWPWVRNVCKYGDFFLYLDIEDEIGIINVTPLSPYEVNRVEGFNEENPYEYKFTLEGSHSTPSKMYGSGVSARNTEFKSYEIAHFRLLSDTNFLPYGRSMIEPGRKIFKQLMLMEDAMLIQRIMRAPERRIFKVDVGTIPPNEVDSYMKTIMDKMKKVPYIDERTGDYNLKFNMQNMIEDFFLPVRGSESGTTIESLPGLTNDGQIEDIDYLKNKLFSALKIPKAFLGYDEGVEGKSTLAAEDVRFARTIERIQKIIVSELTKIAIIHLFAQGFKDEDLINFSLSLTNPSLIYQKQMLEMLKEQLDVASQMKDMRMWSDKYIYENVFKLSETEWKAERELVIEDLKEDFRKEQISGEGNDPKETNMSFGTPHDIAMMHVSTRNGLLPGMEQQHVGGTGRPERISTWGTHDSDFGRDPLAIKDISGTFKQEKNPLSPRKRNESKEKNTEFKDLINYMRRKQLVVENLYDKNDTQNEPEYLNENQILDTDN